MRHCSKKLLVTTLLIGTMSLVGCGVNNDLTLDEIENKMSKNVTFESMEKGNSKSLKRFYKLNASDYELKTKGDYVFFAVSKDAEKLKESFINSIKE